MVQPLWRTKYQSVVAGRDEIHGLMQLRSNTFTAPAGCYAQKRAESICRRQFESAPLIRVRRADWHRIQGRHVDQLCAQFFRFLCTWGLPPSFP